MREALKVIPPERLVLSSDCGMGREGMSRRHAFYKMVALVQGTNLVKKELGLPQAESLGADPKFSLHPHQRGTRTVRRDLRTCQAGHVAGVRDDQCSTSRPRLVGQDAGRVGAGDERHDPVRRRRDAHEVRTTTAFAEAQGLTFADSYEAILADPTVDAVVLATPHSQHAPQVIAAAQAGKHVFCEKPFALHKAEAEQAVAATQKAGVTLGLGYNRRFHPEMTKLRQQIQSGRPRDGPPLRSDDDVPERAGAEGRRLARATRTRRPPAA